MASFFRKRISQRVLSMLQNRQELKRPSTPNSLSSHVKISRLKRSEAELILPWKGIEQMCDQNITVSPKELVRLLRNQGLPTSEGFIDIKLSESPFLSVVFTVDKHIFSKIVLVNICTNEDDFAQSSCFFDDIEKQNVVVQCSVPAVGEMFNLAHFRTVIHSNFVGNINKFAGHNVAKIAHVEDCGLNAAVFLTGYKQFKTRGIPEKKNAFNLHEVMKAALFQYSNDIEFKLDSDACYGKMKQGDKTVLSEWHELKQMCMEYYNSLYQVSEFICDKRSMESVTTEVQKTDGVKESYCECAEDETAKPKRIGIKFDGIHFDSSCSKKSEAISNQLLDSNIFNKEPTNSDELKAKEYINSITDKDFALYEFSRYITAATEMKERYDFDKMYYVSPSSKEELLSALFYLMKELNYEWANELHHVNLRLIDSFHSKLKKLSIDTVINHVKKGMVTTLNQKLQYEMNKSLEEMAEHLSVSSLIVNDMKQRRMVKYDFDWQDIISFKKDTAASFLLCSDGLKRLQKDSVLKFDHNIDLSPLLEPEAHHLIQHLARFEEILFKSYTYLEPHFLFQYLSSLWYFTDRVTNIIKLDIKSDRYIVIKARLMLLSATLKVLNKALHLLGIAPLKRAYAPENPFVQS